jgi:hypothetical protein
MRPHAPGKGTVSTGNPVEVEHAKPEAVHGPARFTDGRTRCFGLRSGSRGRLNQARYLRSRPENAEAPVVRDLGVTAPTGADHPGVAPLATSAIAEVHEVRNRDKPGAEWRPPFVCPVFSSNRNAYREIGSVDPRRSSRTHHRE